MAITATVNNNGLSGKLYLTIITSNDEKYAGTTRFLLRGFESRERLYSHINGEIKEEIIAFEQEYEMPLVDLNKPTREQIYNWLKSNQFTDAVDA